MFHAISAFCNAGFALFSDSLSQFVSDPIMNTVIAVLIILGGIGFIVTWELTGLVRKKRRQLSLHTRLVLGTSLALILTGFLVFFFFEFDGVLLTTSIHTKIIGSLFQSITTRTAGFNTLPIGSLAPVTLTVMILLMFIGASPGSTGGGIKTSTFAVLVLSIRSVFRGHEQVEIGGKTVPEQSVKRAAALLVAATGLVLLCFILLLSIEQKPYLDLLFETVSAFATVGLSTGITSDLSASGKLLITVLMFLGRIGPLTFGLALMRDFKKSKIQYPSGRVIIG